MTWWWSYLLMAVGVFGLWLAGRKSVWGWAVGLGAQVLWVAYALVTEQYGFLVSATVYGWVYLDNWVKWGGSWQKIWKQVRVLASNSTQFPVTGIGPDGPVGAVSGLEILENIRRVREQLTNTPPAIPDQIDVGCADTVRAAFPIPGLQSRAAGFLDGIPVHVDEDLPRDMWVVRNALGQVIGWGRVE